MSNLKSRLKKIEQQICNDDVIKIVIDVVDNLDKNKPKEPGVKYIYVGVEDDEF